MIEISWAIGCGAVGAAGATLAHAVFNPRSSLFGRVMTRGTSDGPPRIALTFDDGPHPPGTPAILDILRDMGVPAAFFAIGANVERFPELARRIVAEGHLIENHTQRHDRAGAFRLYRYWRDELAAANETIVRATGRRPALFRPPMGIKTPRITSAVRAMGMTAVTWTHRGRDGWPATPQAILNRLTSRTRPGDILVLHDGVEPGHSRDPAATIESIPRIIDALRKRGLEFERLDRLIGLEPYLDSRSK